MPRISAGPPVLVGLQIPDPTWVNAGRPAPFRNAPLRAPLARGSSMPARRPREGRAWEWASSSSIAAQSLRWRSRRRRCRWRLDTNPDRLERAPRQADGDDQACHPRGNPAPNPSRSSSLIPDRSHAPTTAQRCATLPGLARQRHGGHWLSVEMSALDRLVNNGRAERAAAKRAGHLPLFQAG